LDGFDGVVPPGFDGVVPPPSSCRGGLVGCGVVGLDGVVGDGVPGERSWFRWS
jgi:hypothetical protein